MHMSDGIPDKGRKLFAPEMDYRLIDRRGVLSHEENEVVDDKARMIGVDLLSGLPLILARACPWSLIRPISTPTRYKQAHTHCRNAAVTQPRKSIL